MRSLACVSLLLQVEILFQRGLVRVLFATETLCVGLNLPAKTVVFTQITKPASHNSTRHITAAEYTQVRWLLLSPPENKTQMDRNEGKDLDNNYSQMAGRAGRRGLDLHGDSIIFAPDEVPPPKVSEIHGARG